MRSINSILKNKKIDKKLEKLISINMELEGDLCNADKNKQSVSITAVVEALTTISKNTRFEDEIKSILDTCEKYLYK